MNSIREQYDRADGPLTALLDAVEPTAWSSPSPCEGWQARDVVRHIIETQRDFLTGHGADLGPAPDVDTDPAAAWREHAARVRAALTDELAGTSFDGFFGPSTVGRTFGQFYVWDMLVHRWDVARAVGVEARLTDDELDSVEAGRESFGEALYMDGICKPAVDARADADRLARVLASLGRDLSTVPSR